MTAHFDPSRPSLASRPSRRGALAALAVATLLALGLAACGDTSSDDVKAGSNDATTTAPEGGDEYGDTTGGGTSEGATVEAKDFSLTSITVAPGTEVTFKNEGEAPHTMTADDGAFDSGNVEAGSTASVTAPSEPGAYPFHCEIHPKMTGTLTVAG